MPSEHTVSHHLLRRRARARVRWIERLQASARDGNDPDFDWARRKLESYGVSLDDALAVVPAKHGPWRWRVIAG